MLSPRNAAASTVVVLLALAAGLGISSAQAAAAVQLVSSSSYSHTHPEPTDHAQHIAGEVVNSGSTYLTTPQVTVEFRDSAGQVSTTTVAALVRGLAPGEKSPFGLRAPLGYDQYTVTGVSAGETQTPPNHRFTLSFTESTDGAGFRYLTGTVRNDNTAAAVDVSIAFTFYDANGRTVAVALAFPDDASYDLAAGETKPAQLVLAPDFPAYTSYTALAQSDSAPSPTPAPLPSPTPTTTPTDPTTSPEPSPSTTVSPSESASATPSASESASASATPSATETAVSSSSPTPSATTSGCTSSLQLSSYDSTAGAPVTASIAGPPGRAVTLEAYSQPSTTYAAVRPEVTLDAFGMYQTTISTATNTRLRARETGCDVTTGSALLRVRPVLTFVVRRDGQRRYSFEGRLLPGAVNAGRAISLYYRLPGGTPVRRAIAYLRPDGTFGTTVAFSGSARVDVDVRTGANVINESGRSRTRSLLVY